jgi:hypothetical protein
MLLQSSTVSDSRPEALQRCRDERSFFFFNRERERVEIIIQLIWLGDTNS